MDVDKPARFLRLKTVIQRTGLSRSTIYRKIGEGTFPRQVRLAERCVGWREAHVEEWLSQPISTDMS